MEIIDPKKKKKKKSWWKKWKTLIVSLDEVPGVFRINAQTTSLYMNKGLCMT